MKVWRERESEGGRDEGKEGKRGFKIPVLTHDH